MKFKTNYLVIPAITVVIALLGSHFTGLGMDWYDQTLTLPALTPPKWAFPLAWTIIYICTAISAIILWNKGQESKRILWFFRRENMSSSYWWIIGLFIANVVLNIAWTVIFFGLHQIFAASIEILILELSILALLYLTWSKSKSASLLLLPYAIWVGFASYLTWQILLLNT